MNIMLTHGGLDTLLDIIGKKICLKKIGPVVTKYTGCFFFWGGGQLLRLISVPMSTTISPSFIKNGLITKKIINRQFLFLMLLLCF